MSYEVINLSVSYNQTLGCIEISAKSLEFATYFRHIHVLVAEYINIFNSSYFNKWVYVLI